MNLLHQFLVYECRLQPQPGGGMLRFLFVLFFAVTLAGCNTMQPGSDGGKIWLRSDGLGPNNPALARQFKADKAACSVSGGVDAACMTGRGYLLVSASEAATLADSLRASADDKKCVNEWYTKRGTPEYTQCRAALIQNNGQKSAADITPSQQMLNCTSTGLGNSVYTNCY